MSVGLAWTHHSVSLKTRTEHSFLSDALLSVSPYSICSVIWYHRLCSWGSGCPRGHSWHILSEIMVASSLVPSVCLFMVPDFSLVDVTAVQANTCSPHLDPAVLHSISLWASLPTFFPHPWGPPANRISDLAWSFVILSSLLQDL